ncbi:MAG TPA: metal-sensitive transcriptional regulator [Anaerolineales bacterium]|nr:metal-sensitive transcriptional regulator [Anaerolineales bacterium]
MNVQSTAVKEDIQVRLRRIEGQVRGVHRMVDEDRDCREIVQQLKAVQSAVKTATNVFLQAYARECLLNDEALSSEERAALVDDLLNLMTRIES